jgi:hypothetical protein
MCHEARWDEAYPTDNAWNYRSWDDHRGRRRLGRTRTHSPDARPLPIMSYWYKQCSNYCGANKYYAPTTRRAITIPATAITTSGGSAARPPTCRFQSNAGPLARRLRLFVS